ncbi:UDP-glycosyltransferase TURAN [Tanacetum coccineum]
MLTVTKIGAIQERRIYVYLSGCFSTESDKEKIDSLNNLKADRNRLQRQYSSDCRVVFRSDNRKYKKLRSECDEFLKLVATPFDLLRNMANLDIQQVAEQVHNCCMRNQYLDRVGQKNIDVILGANNNLMKKKEGRAEIVVLGDIGRSPRMQYHALSLATQAGDQALNDQTLVDELSVKNGLNWYRLPCSDPHSALLHNQSILIHTMRQWPGKDGVLPKLFRRLMLLLKPLVQFVMLLWLLCVKIKAPDVFIVQNPPYVPTLVAVKWASWPRHSFVIIDWHNFGYTLLALSLGRTKLEEKHKLFCRIKKDMFRLSSPLDCISYGITSNDMQDQNTTLFTDMIGEDYHLKQTRLAETPDEDFGILLEAAVMYDRRVTALLNENDSNGDEVL